MALLIVFVALAIPWTYLNITLGLKLERELQAIRDRGEPLTLEQVIPQDLPREQNAAYVYEQAFRVFQKWPHAPEGGVPGTPLSGLNQDTQNAVAAFISGDDLAPEARAWLFSADVEARLDAIARASRMERCVFPVNWEDGFAALNPHLAQFRAAQRLVTARMMIAGREGRTDEALGWCEVGLRMSRHLADEPTLIAFLVRVAMLQMLLQGAQDTCAHVDVPPQAVGSLTAVIDAQDPEDGLRRALEGERAWLLPVFDQGDLTELGASPDGPAAILLRLYATPLFAPVRKHDELTYLRFTEALLTTLQHPYREAASMLPQREDYMHAHGYLEPLTWILLPVFSRTVAKRDAAIARLDQFRVALALNLYRQAHGGYPETLAPLPEVVDWPIPDDIFSGGPFRYRREGVGYVLWSLGPDLEDDGGQDYREEGRSWDDSDIVWRVEG